MLANTFEYRHPSEQQIKAASNAGGQSVKLDMNSRYLGLVVVPGQHIAKIEVEEFASQMKSRSALAKKPVQETTRG